MRNLGTGWLTVKGDNNQIAYILRFEEKSVNGINNGRISKLEIRGADNRIICNYDRGWDLRPGDACRKFYMAIIKKYN